MADVFKEKVKPKGLSDITKHLIILKTKKL